MVVNITTNRGISLPKKSKDLVFSHWESWSPREYLNTYFSKLGQDSYENLKFLVKELGKLKKNSCEILDFGAGPTIFAAIAAAPYATKIHICDYLEGNLKEISKSIHPKSDAFDWTPCIKHILSLEGSACDMKAVNERKALLKEKLEVMFRCDISLDWPLFTHDRKKYPVVISNFCADSATSSKEVWFAYMKNLMNLVQDGGTLMITALRNCKFYNNGGYLFPSANINERDLRLSLLSNGFRDNFSIQVKSVPECKNDGFTSIMFVSATKLTKKEGDVIKVYRKLTKNYNQQLSDKSRRSI